MIQIVINKVPETPPPVEWSVNPPNPIHEKDLYGC
jgi:hypothetical protein